MGKVRYGQHGYVGSSMSARAVEAYANGEMPKSKWTKAAMLYAIDNQLNEFEDDQKITSDEREELFNAINAMKKEEMFNIFMENSSWHHTGKFANATDFYRVSEDLEDFERFAIEQIPDSKFGKRSYEDLHEQIEWERKAQEEQEKREAERHINQERFKDLLTQGEKDFSDKILENINLEGLSLEGINFSYARFDHCKMKNLAISKSTFRLTSFVGSINNMSMQECQGDFDVTFVDTIDGLDISHCSSLTISREGTNKPGVIHYMTIRESEGVNLVIDRNTAQTSVTNLTVDKVTGFGLAAKNAVFDNATITNSGVSPDRLRHTTIHDSHIENSEIRLYWQTFEDHDLEDFTITNTELSNMTIQSNRDNTPEALGFNRINFTNSSFTGVLEEFNSHETKALPYSVDTRQLERKENLSTNQPLGKEGIRNLIAEQTQQKIQLGETQTPLTQQQEQQHLNR